MLQSEGTHQPKHHTQSHGDGEREQEDPNSVEKGGEVYVFTMELGKSPAL
jgi:hypothetical protein